MSSCSIDVAPAEQLCYIPCNFCNIVLAVYIYKYLGSAFSVLACYMFSYQLINKLIHFCTYFHCVEFFVISKYKGIHSDPEKESMLYAVLFCVLCYVLCVCTFDTYLNSHFLGLLVIIIFFLQSSLNLLDFSFSFFLSFFCSHRKSDNLKVLNKVTHSHVCILFYLS